jgi:hypothetical protein
MARKRKQSQGQLSKTLLKSQAINLYSPVTHTRFQHHSALATKLMHDSFLNNSSLWQLTSNCKVVAHNDKFRIRLLLRKRPDDKKGDRRASHSNYATVIDAENDAFLFRYSLESAKSKKILDDYETNLKALLQGTTGVSTIQLEAPASIKVEEAPVKIQRQLSAKKQKSFGMSASYYLNERTRNTRKMFR